MNVLAIDWSGEKSGGPRKIWLALSSHGHLRELESGRSRDEIAEHLICLADEEPSLVVGFDFAFSMPEWFVRAHGVADAREFWSVVEEEGERWLRECPAPFFGHEGTRRPSDVELYRKTDRDAPAIVGRQPKSVFQIAGSGQVGPGSIRGMAVLKRLSEAGFRVWPFDQPALGEPLVVEIYPRLLTGPVVKNDRNSRLEHLDKYAARIDARLSDIAAGDEDEFDAAISAAVMNRYLDELVELPAADEVDRVEGRIWHPQDRGFRPGDPLPEFLDPALPQGRFIFEYDDGLTDGPFNSEDAQLMNWERGGVDGTVGLGTGGTPRYLRALRRSGDRVFTADGVWIRLVPVANLEVAD